MKKTFIGALVVGLLAFGGVALADDGVKGGADAAMMEKMQKQATPGEAHKWLAKSVGKWDCTIKLTMGPGAPALESKGSAEFTAVLGGRFVRQDFSGTMMGMPFHGLGYNGYDNFKQQFSSTWMDEVTTSMMIQYGTLDKDGKSATFTGLMDEPTTGEKNKKVKSVVRWADDNTMVFEMWDKAKGKEWKALEITYTRAK